MNTLSDRIKGINLYFVGMMGAGKTTIGKILAKQFGYQFIDTDTVIERVTGQSVSEIFASWGEEMFRDLETQVLEELSPYTRRAIATGGGIVLRRQNWSYLRHGLVIWLDVPVEQLYHRLKGDTTRPLLQNIASIQTDLIQTDPPTQTDPIQKLKTILEERQHLYAQADVRVVVQAKESSEQVAARVLEEIPKVLKPEIMPPQTSQFSVPELRISQIFDLHFPE